MVLERVLALVGDLVVLSSMVWDPAEFLDLVVVLVVPDLLARIGELILVGFPATVVMLDVIALLVGVEVLVAAGQSGLLVRVGVLAVAVAGVLLAVVEGDVIAKCT